MPGQASNQTNEIANSVKAQVFLRSMLPPSCTQGPVNCAAAHYSIRKGLSILFLPRIPLQGSSSQVIEGISNKREASQTGLTSQFPKPPEKIDLIHE
jgi:hypothetical protein